jgi:hypothetical protein
MSRAPNVKLDTKATAGVHIQCSIKRVLKKIFNSSNIGRITNQQHGWVIILSWCLFTGTDSMNMAATMIGMQAGLSSQQTRRYLLRSLMQSFLFNSGKKGYKLIEIDQDRTKYTEEERDAFKKQIQTDCDVVIKNTLKNDAIWKGDHKGKVVIGSNNKPLEIQKR